MAGLVSPLHQQVGALPLSVVFLSKLFLASVVVLCVLLDSVHFSGGLPQTECHFLMLVVGTHFTFLLFVV